MPLKFLTGLRPDRYETRMHDREVRLYTAANLKALKKGVEQHIPVVRDQQSFPSCAGQALAACIDMMTNAAPAASAVSIWREARRRQGKVESIDEGIRFEWAIEGLTKRGWDPYVSGEDSSREEAGLGAAPAGDDLADELFAAKHKLPGQRWRVDAEDRLDQIEDALGLGLGVVFGTGVQPRYMRFQGDKTHNDVVLNEAYLGGDFDGHGQRIAGHAHNSDGRRIYLVQNSWGMYWGGCHLSDGTWQPGCCWVDETVIRKAWDVHVLEVEK